MKGVKEHKTFLAELETEEKGGENVNAGYFKAIFAQLGDQPDRAGDETDPTAFDKHISSGKSVIVEGWNHNQGQPVGKGFVKSDGKKAWFEGNFFLNTQAGREAYETVKALGDTEWSYTFVVTKTSKPRTSGSLRRIQSVDVLGVSPVTRGAGSKTGLVSIKSESQNGDSFEGSDMGGFDLLKLKIEIEEERQ